MLPERQEASTVDCTVDCTVDLFHWKQSWQRLISRFAWSYAIGTEIHH
jgi:hypothetical protein